MTTSRDEVAPGRPLGFPNCPWCAYLRHGLPSTCITCVEGISTSSSTGGHCPVCDEDLVDGLCTKDLCADEHRRIKKIHSIVRGSATMHQTISRYRDERRTDWSVIFGRLIVGWLDQHARVNPPDLIVANPTFIASNSTFSHTESVLAAAANEDVLGEWPIDTRLPRLLTKATDTSRSIAAGITARRTAKAQLYYSLQVTEPAAFEAKRVLLYDNESVTGSELDTVARFLLDEGGAAQVEGLVLLGSASRQRKRATRRTSQ